MFSYEMTTQFRNIQTVVDYSCDVIDYTKLRLKYYTAVKTSRGCF